LKTGPRGEVGSVCLLNKNQPNPYSVGPTQHGEVFFREECVRGQYVSLLQGGKKLLMVGRRDVEGDPKGAGLVGWGGGGWLGWGGGGG